MVDIFVDKGSVSPAQILNVQPLSTGATAPGGANPNASSTEFTVTAEPGKFLIDGTAQKTITLDEGKTYKFDVSDTSLSSHPFKFSSTVDGTHGSGAEYVDGVTLVGTQGTSGAYIEVTLPLSAPSALNYYCSAHPGMGAAISTNDAQISTQYVDKDYNWIGDSFDDGSFSRSFIKVSKDDGSKVEISVDGNRSSLYNFDDKDVTSKAAPRLKAA
jgi:hypothetical protein